MLDSLINNKVYYKVFDKDFTESTHIYSFHIAEKHNKQREEVIHNQQLIKSYLGANELLILKQTHSNIVVDADMLQEFSTEVEGDGAITTRKNLILTIQTADCVPVLFTDISGNIIGAAHCGWKGAKANIIRIVVEKMKLKGAKDFIAYIGPSIKQQSYEVNKDFYQEFLSESLMNQKFFIPSSKLFHYLFDLPGFVMSKLHELSIKNIIISDDDTYAMPNKYPSFRYKTHNNLIYDKTIFSTIVMK